MGWAVSPETGTDQVPTVKVSLALTLLDSREVATGLKSRVGSSLVA